MTKSHFMRESEVVISSAMPSVKYSCSGSPLMFWNGSTAIDGLSGSVGPAGEADAAGTPFGDQLQAGMGPAGEAEASRCGDFLEAGRNVHAVAEDVVAIDDDVTDVDTGAEGDAAIL